MSISIGLDIGGTKVAGAAFDDGGRELARRTVPIPASYDGLVQTCRDIVAELEAGQGHAATVGACAPFASDTSNANIPMLIGRNLQADLAQAMGRAVPFENDANCAALAEAVDGAGRDYARVFGLIIGTGVGGGMVVDGVLQRGANGMLGEVGHLPLPYYVESDGDKVPCGCGQVGCIEKLMAGPALTRLNKKLTGRDGTGHDIRIGAEQGSAEDLRVLDHYFTIVAKGLVAVLHTFDPDIITVSGGLNHLPGFYEAVPQRWGQFTIAKRIVTQLVPASYGPMAGLRGAALTGQAARDVTRR